MSARKVVLLIALLTLIVLGCKFVEQGMAPATPTPEPTATTAPSPTPAPTDTPPPTPDAAATQTALAALATPTQAEQPQATTPPSPEPPSQGNTAILERMISDGAIGTTEGEYYRIGDFDESWAQLGWYQWWTTGYTAENFVISANTAWESASDRANWPEAGCGFVFSLSDKDNHMLAYLGLDGFARIAQMSRGNFKMLANKRYGKVSIPNGDAKIAMAVFNKRVNFYVNDQRVSSANASSITSGDIALTLLSGTNKDFGTRCQLTDIDLWILK